MKSFFPALAVLVIALASCSGSRKATAMLEDCKEEICTEIFSQITLTIKGSDGLPIRLDEAYTMRLSTGDVLRYERAGRSEGIYIITDDSYRKILQNKEDIFQFIGKIDGREVVQENYRIFADCCHVYYKEGRKEVVLKTK